MSNKHLLTSLSSVLRRTLTLTSHFSFNSTRWFQSGTFFSPNVKTHHRLFPCSGLDFLGIHNIPGKCFTSSQSAEKASAKCWNCSAAAEAVPFLLCSSCRCIQPVDQSVDYFQIFGLERKYDSVVDNLEGKYKAWQKKLHPDLVHTKSKEEREYAAEQSARVIDAYLTLSKPLVRAIYIQCYENRTVKQKMVLVECGYLLKLEGVDVDEEETLSESELLTEILEIREAVEEAADSQALLQIQSQMQEKLKHWSNSFANAFRSRNFDEALKAIRRMTYYQRVKETIVKKL